MPVGTSRARHRLEFAAAVALAVGAVYGLSRLSRLVKGSDAPTVSPVVAPPFVEAPPIVPRVDPPLPSAAPKVATLSPEFLAAAREGNVARMNALSSAGMPVDHALAIAAESGSVDAVTWILDHGADVHTDESNTEAPILAADAHPAIVRLLLARGANEPSLTVAAEALAPNAVKRLLAKGESARPRPDDGSSPLQAAFAASADVPAARRQSLVDALLAGGADPNFGTPGPLGVAIDRCGDAEPEHLAAEVALVRALVAHGALPDASLLSRAFHLPGGVLDALLSGRQTPHAVELALGDADGEGDAAAVKKLLARPVAWSYRDEDGDQRSPLFAAAFREDPRLVRAMLEAGAPADSHFKDGRSALGLALDGPADQAHVEVIVELLLEHGANANRVLENGRTPLHIAAAIGNTRVINALLAHGARVNAVSGNTTPLDEAGLAGYEDAARVLAAHGGRHARITE